MADWALAEPARRRAAARAEERSFCVFMVEAPGVGCCEHPSGREGWGFIPTPAGPRAPDGVLRFSYDTPGRRLAPSLLILIPPGAAAMPRPMYRPSRPSLRAKVSRRPYAPGAVVEGGHQERTREQRPRMSASPRHSRFQRSWNSISSTFPSRSCSMLKSASAGMCRRSPATWMLKAFPVSMASASLLNLAANSLRGVALLDVSLRSLRHLVSLRSVRGAFRIKD